MDVIFFYGITFRGEQCRRKLLFKDVAEFQPSEGTRQAGGFDEDRWYAEFYLDEGINHVEECLKRESDPIQVGSMHSYDDLRLYLGIRDTFHGSEEAFDLGKVEKEEWHKLICEKCNEWGIQWVTPQFHMLVARRD
jgi:hypothetical protein